MKNYQFIFLWVIAQTAYGQSRDVRALLNIEGRIKNISISPDDKIWLTTAMGKTYFANSIDSNWHYGTPVYKSESKGDFSMDGSELDNISFFNNDTAIMTGNIALNKEKLKYNGIYRTQDGGKTWAIINFGGDQRIYHAHTDEFGNAWMGGSSGAIHYSKDYGKHWKLLNSPFNSASRMHFIFMRNAQEGIASALENEIHTTRNNWKSHTSIPTPLDQKKYSHTHKFSDNRIEKIVYWNQFLVVSQDGHCFYTQNDAVNWKAFPTQLIDFEVDKQTNTLLAITKDLKIASFSNPLTFSYWSDKSLVDVPIAIRNANNSLYIICSQQDIYKVTATQFTRITPYSSEHKIKKPDIIQQTTNWTWGATDNHLYLSENQGKDWFREARLDFGIMDLSLLDDTTAILWTGKENYLYALKDHTYSLYLPTKPIDNFLRFPVKQFTINSTTHGCFHFEAHAVEYTANGNLFHTKIYKKKTDSLNKAFQHQASKIELQTILSDINSNTYTMPALEDFNLTEIDKKNYIQSLNFRKNQLHYDFEEGFIPEKDKLFYETMPNRLDTLSASVLPHALDKAERGWSTTSYYFLTEFINENNDTLNVGYNYFVSANAWMLPWRITYNGLTFKSYNLGLSKYIAGCLPEDFLGKPFFDNKLLILQIARYLKSIQEGD